MKPKLFLLALLTVSLFSLTACEKEKEDEETTEIEIPPFVTPTGEAANIMGKWGINSITINKQFGSTSDKQVFTGAENDYVDFRNDGKMHTSLGGKLDISEYRVKNSRSMSIDMDPATINTLTDSRLVITSRDETGTFGYTEVVYDLKK